MWMRMRFDIRWSDVAAGVAGMVARADRGQLDRQVRECWPSPERMFCCLSVRTGFDLLWKSLELSPGSEVLMSALTIADMVRVVEHHGLVPVPVDLDRATMAPDLDRLRQAITPATRAIVVAHLFGGRVPLGPIVEIAREHNLLVIEDCAQAFVGCDYDGQPGADVTMYSFGPIKTITAYGGGMFHVRDPELLARMKSLEKLYPVQGRLSYLKRFTKYTVLKALSCRPVCDAIISVYRAIGFDYDKWISRTVRAFPGPQWLDRLRCQPSVPLLRLMERRFRTFDPAWIEARTARAEHLIGLMPAGAMRPAEKMLAHSYWVFPILADDPHRLIAELTDAGFDATYQGSLRAVEPPADRPELDPQAARRMLAGMVFLPLCAEMPQREIDRLAKVLHRHEECLIIDQDAAKETLTFPSVAGTDARLG